jgi:hypothetical protein
MSRRAQLAQYTSLPISFEKGNFLGSRDLRREASDKGLAAMRMPTELHRENMPKSSRMSVMYWD